MNKLEANVSLFLITFFAAIQYVFLANIPETVSDSAFLCITNLIGFFITLAIFHGDLFQLNWSHIKKSLLLSVELFGFNLFLLLGASKVGATVCASVLSAYFMFVPLIYLLLFHKKPEKNKIAAVVLVLFGLFLFMNLDVKGLLNRYVCYLLVADAFFAIFIITTEKFAAKSNPAILATGEMFFNFLLGLCGWVLQSAVAGEQLSLPQEPEFWGSVLFISFFIRGLYGVVQIYAQRYVSAMNTALIFSTEIIMTMLLSPVLAILFGTEAEEITLMKLAGGAIMMIGILLADSEVVQVLQKRRKRIHEGEA